MPDVDGLDLIAPETTDAVYGYDIRGEVLGEAGTVELAESSPVIVKREGRYGGKVPVDWRERFLRAYDIEFQATRFNKDGTKAASPVLTLQHNGVIIHDKLELKESFYTGGEKGVADKPGAIMLQNYVGKVYYRNIWVVEKK